MPVPSASRPWAREDSPAVPPRSLQAKWREEHPYEMRPWDRPGALARTSIPRVKFIAQRPEIQVTFLLQPMKQFAASAQ